jgi:hypothetical protein
MCRLQHHPGFLLIVLFALTGLAACGSPSAPAATPTSTAPSLAGDFVGVTNGADGIALSTNGQQLLAYACDGPPSRAVTYAVWFKGTVSHNAANLTAADESHLVVTLTAQDAFGTVILRSGQRFSFTAPAVKLTTGAGLYRDEETFAGVRYLAGLIIPPMEPAPPTSGSSVPASAALQRLALTPLLPIMIGPEPEWRGGIINEQTGALSSLPITPEQEFLATRQIAVPNLGTFTMTQCHQGQC